MYIKDILKTSALLLAKENVLTYLNGDQSNLTTLATINNMTSLANIVISELASTYIPMVKQEVLSVKDQKIYYTDLSERVLSVLNVTDTEGKEVRHKIFAEYIFLSASTAVVEYEFSPPNYDLLDNVVFSNAQVDERVLAYGLNAEVCISEGRFSEAVTWHKRYVDAIANICKPKNSTVKQRRWA